MTVTIYMRDLPALGRNFDTTLRDCPSFDTQLTEYGSGSGSEPIGTATHRTTLTTIEVPGVDGDYHGYTSSELDMSSSGTSGTSADEYRLVGNLRGVTFVASLFDGSDIGSAAVDRNLATLSTTSGSALSTRHDRVE